jgi:hypothetical protein
MANAPPTGEVYQLHAFLLDISPTIWRRLLVRSDATLADLHHILQIAFGWTDSHLHRFVIHGKEYGIAQPCGIFFADDPQQVRLRDLGLRLNMRFGYEYDFGDRWQHQLRLERILRLKRCWSRTSWPPILTSTAAVQTVALASTPKASTRWCCGPSSAN